tara:strand:+ start:106 stop:585 length:480 start_codon:yes stop_codon:yes gene_type:complete
MGLFDKFKKDKLPGFNDPVINGLQITFKFQEGDKPLQKEIQNRENLHPIIDGCFIAQMFDEIYVKFEDQNDSTVVILEFYNKEINSFSQVDDDEKELFQKHAGDKLGETLFTVDGNFDFENIAKAYVKYVNIVFAGVKGEPEMKCTHLGTELRWSMYSS